METNAAPALTTLEPPPSHLFLRVQSEIGDGFNLIEYILASRAQGVPYRKMADDLRARSGVDLTHEAPRRWHKHLLAQLGESAEPDAE